MSGTEREHLARWLRERHMTHCRCSECGMALNARNEDMYHFGFHRDAHPVDIEYDSPNVERILALLDPPSPPQERSE